MFTFPDAPSELVSDISTNDVRRFGTAAEIRDEAEFTSTLQQVVGEKLEIFDRMALMAAELVERIDLLRSSIDASSAQPGSEVADPMASLIDGLDVLRSSFDHHASQAGRAVAGPAQPFRAAAMALQAEYPWAPSASDFQRGRAQMLKDFKQAHNLPLAQYAELANKSRQQIYKDIAKRRLLVLSVGARGQRIPDWQLDPLRADLTRRLLVQAPDVDEWTLYHLLRQPAAALDGKSPLDAVNQAKLGEVVSIALGMLGLAV